MSRPPRFAVIGLDHPHAHLITSALMSAGAEPAGFHSEDDDAAGAFLAAFGDVTRAADLEGLVTDDTIDVVVPVGVPSERADVSILALQGGRAVLADKPAVTTETQLAALRETVDETDALFAVWFSERVGSPATERALRLVDAGAVGEVVQVTGFGPHRLGLEGRPPWFSDPQRHGGLLNDLASHQIDQFLHLAGCRSGDIAEIEIVSSMVANRAHPGHPALEDHGELLLRTPDTSGFIRVDWLTADGLPSWGDLRLFVTGTEGSIEVRKNVDPGGLPGGEHLILVDRHGIHRFDCSDDPLPFAGEFLADVRAGTMTHASPHHYLAVCELALRAQAGATRMGHLRP